MIYQVISALIAVYFSCIVFEAPKRLLIHISIIGGIGWFVYLFFLDRSGLQLATYYSGLTIAFLSHIAARYFKAPVTVFFIPGFSHSFQVPACTVPYTPSLWAMLKKGNSSLGKR